MDFANYSKWKTIILCCFLGLAILFAMPNLYGQKFVVEFIGIDSQNQIEQIFNQFDTEQIKPVNIKLDDLASFQKSVLLANKQQQNSQLEFADTNQQLLAKDIIKKHCSNCNVTVNLMSNAPKWLDSIGAKQMLLGLDLRGGVHFTLQIDKQKIIDDLNRQMQNQDNIDKDSVNHQDHNTIQNQNQAQHNTKTELNNAKIEAAINSAVEQNILILHNRVNELGVSEPVIYRQGLDRVVVELPGIQDIMHAKSIIGRTASLEARLVADDVNLASDSQYEWLPYKSNQASNHEQVNQDISIKNDTNDNDNNSQFNNGRNLLVTKMPSLTGNDFSDASSGFDQNGLPAVHLVLNRDGVEKFTKLTAENVGKRLAMVLVDGGRYEVITAPVIRSVIVGNRVEISGAMDIQEAKDLGLLLKAGSLSAPMNIVEESTIGPSIGAQNIQHGFLSIFGGLLLIGVFICIYYRLFGLFAFISLLVNLLFLIAILSVLQATITLPGIAAIALTLGVAIDANVLINERIREELLNDKKAYLAIIDGYKHAWATILDSNITTFIAGVALLSFTSGSVRGFAIVHCLGIITSIFSAVFVSHGLACYIYVRKCANKILI